MIRRLLQSAMLLLLLLTGPRLIYSQTGKQSPPDETIKLSVELVVLDVQVINKKAYNSVSGLRKEDFIVYEDGVKQDLAHFSQDQLPVSMVLVLDTSSSVWPFMNQIRDAGREALQGLKADDEVALVATSSRTELVQDFTKDKQLIADKIANIDEKALGYDGILIHDAVYQAARHLRAAKNPESRRVMIVITDNASSQLRNKGHSENETLHELYENGISVCGIITPGRPMRVIPIGLLFGKRAFTGNIKSYASKTGGIVMEAGKEGIKGTLIQLIEKLRARYTLGYIPTNKNQDGRFRKIKVGVSPIVERREGSLTVLSRQGDYGVATKRQLKK